MAELRPFRGSRVCIVWKAPGRSDSVVPTIMDYVARREHYRDLVREAERERLVRLTERRTGGIGSWLARLPTAGSCGAERCRLAPACC